MTPPALLVRQPDWEIPPELHENGEEVPCTFDGFGAEIG
jgi:hypothetical protein